MADLFTTTVDSSALDRAITEMPEVLAALVNDACHETADAVVNEMRARLHRQLSAEATGETEAGIHAIPAYDGNGWVVLADNDRMPNLPLYLEKGTKPGKRKNYARTDPRPFFYASLELEAGPHERRLVEAMQTSATETGLADT